MSHTKEPWNLTHHMDIHPNTTMYWLNKATSVGTENKHDARRIVAAVNACEGVSNESLDRHVTLYRAKVAQDVERNELTRQRDELLKVAERLVAWNTTYPSSRVYGYGDIKQIAAEMDAINAAAKASIAHARGQCGRINNGHTCTMPAGSSCPDCGPSCHSVPEGA